MRTIEKILKYYELVMTYEDTSKYINYEIPKDYHIEFYKEGDEKDWVNIHINSGEFTSYEKGLQYFNDFFNHFKDELNKRCFFIVNDKNEKIATATISLLESKEDSYEAAVDWVAITEEYQGKKLAKPLISYFIKLANRLGHKKLILHTQTHTWLAAKLYLDFGFKPYKVNENMFGWQILKTITNHPILNEIKSIREEEMYSKTAIKIVNELEKIHKQKFNYEIWYNDGKNDVFVYDFNNYYEYKYYKENDNIILERVK